MNLSFHEHLQPRPRMSRRVLRGFSPEAFKDALGAAKAPDISRKTGVSTSALYAWANGTRTPQVDNLARVMAVLGKRISDVVFTNPEDRFPGDWRNLAGMLQPQLASAANIPTTNLTKIERGELKLSDELAATLASLLGTTAEQYRQAYVRACERDIGTSA